LHVNVDSASETDVARFQATDGSDVQFLDIGVDAASNLVSYDATGSTGGAHVWRRGGSEAMRIDSSSRLLVGTSSSRTDYKLQVEGTASSNGWGSFVHNSNDSTGAIFKLLKSRGTAVGSNTVVQSGDSLGRIDFDGADGSTNQTAATIRCDVDGTPGAGDMPGRLVFSTTADGTSSPTERMRISQGGFVGIGETAPDRQLTVKTTENGRWVISGQHTQASGQLLHLNANSSSYADVMSQLRCDRAANSAYSFFIMDSNYAATPDREFTIRGDGNAFADGTWSGGGADYAEYFEWSDGNLDEEDRRGISVVLDGNQIRPAADGEDPIGVISGNPSVVGDAAWNKWVGKYLRDDYGTYILDENGDRQLNPAYDPDQEYVPREQRPEWDCVGLMGKLRIRKGQRTGSRWIKMRDISDSVEEWLVR
jgi:hypothetical protein